MVHFDSLPVKFENFLENRTCPWERILMLTHSFLIQRKAQDVYFEMEKFFTPIKSFLPPFLLMHCHHKHENFNLIIRYSPYSRGGKKLFTFWQVDFQVLPEEKIKWIAWKLIILCAKQIRYQISFFGIKIIFVSGF